MILGLDGKVGVVTGGTRGIGLATVRTLVSEGVRVAYCARTVSEVEKLQAELGSQVRGYTGDVMDSKFIDDMIRETSEVWGDVSLAVANVGGMSGGSLMSSTDEDWQSTFQINAGHCASLARACTPYMERRGGGSIVFVSSISGWKPAPTLQYGAAKAAVSYMATSLGRHLAAQKIRVNAISPGSILELDGVWDKWRVKDPDGFKKFIARELPFGRLGTAQEIADAITFLLSERASWIAGTDIHVDGAQERPSATPW